MVADLPDRLRELAVQARTAARSPRWERPLLAVAALLFIAIFVVALDAVPDSDLDVRWPVLVGAALVGVPLTVAVNGAEYAATAEVVGRTIRRGEALRIAVLSSAANLLPVPGAVLVRARALNQLGTTYRRAFAATAVVGVAWMGATGVSAGALLLAAGDEPVAGAGFLAAGTLLIAGISRGRSPALLARILVVEAATVAVGGLRYYLVLRGLGLDVNAGQAVALTVGAVVASAVGIFPGGLGLRELVAGAISPLVGLPAAVGLVGVAVDRLIGLPLLAVLALGFAGATRREGSGSAPAPPGPLPPAAG